MKALILNSGLGSRMGALTSEHPKCMTEIDEKDTIISRQLRMLASAGIKDIVITTGYYDDVLVNYVKTLDLDLNITYVKNPIYNKTNYIYSIYCAREYLADDILLMHGDIVFEESVLSDLLNSRQSCMKVSSTIPLPEKDFKAVVYNGYVQKVGVEFFDSAMEAQAMYKLKRDDWKIWLDQICMYCENERRNCYAEVALNDICSECHIVALDVQDRLCTEIDNIEDLKKVTERIKKNG